MYWGCLVQFQDTVTRTLFSRLIVRALLMSGRRFKSCCLGLYQLGFPQ